MMRRGIRRGSYKIEMFMKHLALHLTGESRAVWSSSDSQWYLGGGFWRAVAAEEQLAQELEAGRVFLRNPDYSSSEIMQIEWAMGMILNPVETRKDLVEGRM